MRRGGEYNNEAFLRSRDGDGTQRPEIKSQVSHNTATLLLLILFSVHR